MPAKNLNFQEIIQQNQLNHGIYNLIRIDKQTQSRRNQAQTIQNIEEQQIQNIINITAKPLGDLMRLDDDATKQRQKYQTQRNTQSNPTK